MARYDAGDIPPSPATGHFDAHPAGAPGYPPAEGDLGSTPTLPRYPSSNSQIARPQSTSSLYSAPGAGGTTGAGARYSAYGADPAGRPSAHPLSHAVYADSSNTLAGGQSESSFSVLKTRDEKGSYSRPGPVSPIVVPTVSAIGRVNAGYLPEPTGIRGAYYRWRGAHLARRVDERLIKPKRDDWIDGLKFFAAWIAANGTFFNAVLQPTDYSAIQRGSPLYFLRSFGLGLTMLLMLSGRALASHLWDVPVTSAPGQLSSSSAASPSISWQRLARAMLTRPFRFILPVCFIAGIQWALGATGRTGDCNLVGMDEPLWSQISNFAGYATLVFDSFTHFEWDTVGGQAFAGNLWTNAWFWMASYGVFVTHMMLGNLSSNRYWIYGALIFFSWCTFNYLAVAMVGLVFADMAVHGQFARLQKLPLGARLLWQIVLLALIIVVQFINPIRNGINTGLATINVTSHAELTFADLLTCAFVIISIESSPWMQLILGNIVFRTLGRVCTAGLYLFAGTLTFTLVPVLALSMHNSNSSPSSITGLTWLVMFIASFLLAIPFHFIVELTSEHFGERFANFVTRWGGPTELKHGKSGGKHRAAVTAAPPKA